MRNLNPRPPRRSDLRHPSGSGNGNGSPRNRSRPWRGADWSDCTVITGGAAFIGTNVAHRLLGRLYRWLANARAQTADSQRVPA